MELRTRDDIDPANTWVVSDTHFGHENIVGYSHRPLDHDQVMIAEWRKEVPDDATVLHLGDLNYKSNGFFKHITAKELTGARKLLIRGNHDKSPTGFYRDAGFQLVRPFKIRYNGLPVTRTCPSCNGDGVIWPSTYCDCGDGTRTWPQSWDVSFSHYPWDSADDLMPDNHLRIHGHIHNNGYTRDAYVPFLRNHINLSVEQTKYKPVNLKLLLDAALLGSYPETTDEQRKIAAERKALAQKGELS